WWDAAILQLEEQLQGDSPRPVNGQDSADLTELQLLVQKLEQKLQEFDQALAEEPRTVDRARAEYLETLARYAQQLAVRVVDVLRSSPLADSTTPGVGSAHQELLRVATMLSAKAEERARRTW